MNGIRLEGMSQLARLLGTLGVCWMLAVGVARADRVHLTDGAVIEGKATRQGDKVVIELESGLITLAASDVAKVESSKSAIQRFEELEAEHAKRGVAGLMFLADYCRDHELRARERTLLEKVIELQPDHEAARARLGFVKGEAGWITRAEQARAQGLVLEGGVFITREEQLAREQKRADAEAAKRESEKAALELEQQKVALERAQVELQREQARADAEAAKAAAPPPVQAGYLVYGAPYGHWHDHGCHTPYCRRSPMHRTKPFPIAGVRDPRDTSWSIVGVKDPRKR